jgi:hypothetical protein
MKCVEWSGISNRLNLKVKIPLEPININGMVLLSSQWRNLDQILRGKMLPLFLRIVFFPKSF